MVNVVVLRPINEPSSLRVVRMNDKTPFRLGRQLTIVLKERLGHGVDIYIYIYISLCSGRP